MRRLLRRLALILGILLIFLAAAAYVVGFRPLRDPHPPDFMAKGTLAIQNAKIYTSPDAPPIESGTIVLQDGRIAAVGTDISVPSAAQIIPCDHCVVTAGFWNAHVHFTENKWAGADWQPAAKLNPQLADMLTSRGFTTVVDVGSNLRDTIPIRRRVEAGELLGPKIYTAGSAQYPPHGIPFYLKGTTPWFILKLMPQPATPEEATKDEERNIAEGADVLKLFTGSWVAHGKVLPMPETNARAAVEVAHSHGQLAFAHPSNLAGVLVAMNSGVDVLAHAADDTEGVDAKLLQTIVDRHMAMVPTLKMFENDGHEEPPLSRPHLRRSPPVPRRWRPADLWHRRWLHDGLHD